MRELYHRSSQVWHALPPHVYPLMEWTISAFIPTPGMEGWVVLFGCNSLPTRFTRLIQCWLTSGLMLVNSLRHQRATQLRHVSVTRCCSGDDVGLSTRGRGFYIPVMTLPVIVWSKWPSLAGKLSWDVTTSPLPRSAQPCTTSNQIKSNMVLMMVDRPQPITTW